MSVARHKDHIGEHMHPIMVYGKPNTNGALSPIFLCWRIFVLSLVILRASGRINALHFSLVIQSQNVACSLFRSKNPTLPPSVLI